MPNLLWSDPLTDMSGVAHSINGQALVTPLVVGDKWFIGPPGGANTYDLIENPGGLTAPVSNMNPYYGAVIVNSLGTLYDLNSVPYSSKYSLFQCTAKVPNLTNIYSYGVGFLGGLTWYGVGVGNINGVIEAGIAGTSVNTVIPNQSVLAVCVRLLVERGGNTRAWYAYADEAINPNASFTQFANIPTSVFFNFVGNMVPAIFQGSPVNAGAGSGFTNVVFGDGSSPFQFIAQTFDTLPPTNTTPSFKAYGNGWVGSLRLDFTYNATQNVILPTSLNDNAVKFKSLEINNIGNEGTVKLTIGNRDTVIPAGAVITMDIDPAQYPQHTFYAGSGACKLTYYADTAVNYQFFR